MLYSIRLKDELGRTWNKVTTAYFKILFKHLPGRPKANYEKLSKDSQPSTKISNLGHPKYEC
jgi:hypothetical protein